MDGTLVIWTFRTVQITLGIAVCLLTSLKCWSEIFFCGFIYPTNNHPFLTYHIPSLNLFPYDI